MVLGCVVVAIVVLSKIVKGLQNKSTTVEVTSHDTCSDSFDRLIKLKDLLDKGIISQEEFEEEKKKIMK